MSKAVPQLQQVRPIVVLLVVLFLGVLVPRTARASLAVSASELSGDSASADLSLAAQDGYRIGIMRTDASTAAARRTSRKIEAVQRWKLSSRGDRSEWGRSVGVPEGDYRNFPSVTMEATAYDPGPISCGPHATGHTATGMLARHGVVAVDPKFIPLGTRVYIDGYGEAIAADVGSAIKGNRIDLCFNTYEEAIRFGRRMITVYILGR